MGSTAQLDAPHPNPGPEYYTEGFVRQHCRLTIWSSWLIVSDDKIQITLLIARRGALSRVCLSLLKASPAESGYLLLLTRWTPQTCPTCRVCPTDQPHYSTIANRHHLPGMVLCKDKGSWWSKKRWTNGAEVSLLCDWKLHSSIVDERKKEALGLLLCLELFGMGVRKSGGGDNRNKLGPGIDGKSKEYCCTLWTFL